MPSELLSFPPLYVLVGIYRLLTDPFVRSPVIDKIQHASVRGLVVGAVWAGVSWGGTRWVVRHFLVGGGGGGWLGWGRGARAGEQQGGRTARLSVPGLVPILGGRGVEVDLVLYTHLLILLPQLSSILRFFILKNLRLARSRAYALTVASRGKPAEFWGQGYVEEWQDPPSLSSAPGSGVSVGGIQEKERKRRHEAKWISWVLWWPVQLFLRHYILIPLSPSLPLIVPLFISFLRAITTAEYLHTPYFEAKRMNQEEQWRWIEERVWAYRAFGFTASLLESIPILGLFLSISNRVGAAMWAFDLEKRQHLFSRGVLKPVTRTQAGLFGTGGVGEAGIDVQAAEREIEQWSSRPDLARMKQELDGTSGSGIRDL